MKKLSTLLALCLISAMIWAAPADPQIKGRLIDATSKQVIDFADVLLFKSGDTNPQMHTSPDVKGVFSLQKVKPGTYTLMIRLVGYDIIARENLVISDNTVLNLGDIEMKPLENGLAEVEVVAEKRQLVYKLAASALP